MKKVRSWAWFDEWCADRGISDRTVIDILENYISDAGDTQDFFEYFLAEAAERDID